MDFALTYVIWRFFYRIGDFLRHWYVRSPHMYMEFVIGILRRMDNTLAWRITLKYIFKPLYGDYSLIGHILGFIFRFSRLLIGGVVYLFVFALAALAYLLWLLIPLYILYLIIY
ncbi:MAG: hypothetical protein WCO21_02875 [bacterium]|nr:hypothetical protein [Candidatus Jorgensenbacteria bacterium]